MNIWKGWFDTDCYFAIRLDADALRQWARENGVKMSIQSGDFGGGSTYKIYVSEGEELFILRWL